jgi:hypothetical protein
MDRTVPSHDHTSSLPFIIQNLQECVLLSFLVRGRRYSTLRHGFTVSELAANRMAKEVIVRQTAYPFEGVDGVLRSRSQKA